MLCLLSKGTEHDKPEQTTQHVHAFVMEARPAFCTLYAALSSSITLC